MNRRQKKKYARKYGLLNWNMLVYVKRRNHIEHSIENKYFSTDKSLDIIKPFLGV